MPLLYSVTFVPGGNATTFTKHLGAWYFCQLDVLYLRRRPDLPEAVFLVVCDEQAVRPMEIYA
jgi:hypothetical protein